MIMIKFRMYKLSLKILLWIWKSCQNHYLISFTSVLISWTFTHSNICPGLKLFPAKSRIFSNKSLSKYLKYHQGKCCTRSIIYNTFSWLLSFNSESAFDFLAFYSIFLVFIGIIKKLFFHFLPRSTPRGFRTKFVKKFE